MFTPLKLVLAGLGALLLLAAPSPAEAGQKRGVSAQLVVKAQPRVIYEAIRGLRAGDPADVKELSRDDKQCVLEETFSDLPVIGQATCVYVETYTPFQRIDYRMIRSDKFKAFEGAWVITPQDEENVLVELRSYVDTGLAIPFGRQITDMATLKDVKKRLQIVKQSAESSQQRLQQVSAGRSSGGPGD